MSEQQQNGGSQQDAGKELKKYQAAYQGLLEVLGAKGGDLLKKKRRASTEIVDEVVEKLLKQKNEDFAKQIESEIDAAIQAHIKLEDVCKQKEKELEEVRKKGQKEFTDSANKILQKVQDRKSLADRYKESLKAAVGNTGPEDNSDVDNSSEEQKD